MTLTASAAPASVTAATTVHEVRAEAAATITAGPKPPVLVNREGDPPNPVVLYAAQNLELQGDAREGHEQWHGAGPRYWTFNLDKTSYSTEAFQASVLATKTETIGTETKAPGEVMAVVSCTIFPFFYPPGPETLTLLPEGVPAVADTLARLECDAVNPFFYYDDIKAMPEAERDAKYAASNFVVDDGANEVKPV